MFKLIKKHYHWILAVVLFLITTVRGGVANNLSGLHLIPVTEALNIPRAQFSLAGSASSVVAMLTTLVSGYLIVRYGYRLLFTLFFLLAAGAYTLMGRAESYLWFFVGMTLLGVMNGICGDAGATRIVSVWFHKHRGTVLGVISSATGVGGGIMCIVQTAAIERGTYRASFYLAAALFVVCAVLAFVFVRSHPAKMGLLPYGDGEKLDYKKREHEQDHWHGLSMKQIVRRPTFYMMILGTFLSCTFAYVLFTVVVPHLQDRGLSATQASSLQSVLLLGLAAAKMLTGYLCDAIGARKMCVICISLNAAALVLMTMVSGYTLALVAVFVYVFGLPIVSIIIPLLASSLFGYQAQTEYNGIFISMVSAAAIVASPISNAVFDKIQTYNPVFLIAAALTIPLLAMYLLMYRLADQDRKKLEAEESRSL